MMLESARYEIVLFGRKLLESGLVTGTGGNLSVRSGRFAALSPSGVEYGLMKPEDVVVVDMDGRVKDGRLKPTSEMSLHLALYLSRPDIAAVVHTHSPYACVMACLGREIPVFHYLVALAGRKIPVAPYACFGTPELARSAAGSMGDGKAVLLANHGMVSVGRSLSEAFRIAETVEFAAMVYSKALTLGEPRVLSDAEVDRVMDALKDYGSSVIQTGPLKEGDR
ncbi:MAG TPA: class II aldolase/adducin family protein [Synergistales bacterium]|nr:class II aldolase/adducin family protein [Synergistales bacterium]HQO82633.1 class II aldolase/adducin family protein [Synergistales bacterium]HQQ09930.1 class II aldolase/adducin family protein [Synergistales bacterium]